MYKALVRFADLQDGNRIYEAGETYPRLGFDVGPQRIAELAGRDNRMGYPLIQAVEPPVKTRMPEDGEVVAKQPRTPQKGRRSRRRGDKRD